MDTMDAATKLQQEFDVDWSDARHAVEQEVKDILDDKTTGNSRRRKYSDAVDTAYERINHWIATASEMKMELTWESIAHYHATHRPAGTWATLAGMAIKERKAKQEERIQAMDADVLGKVLKG